MHDIGISMFKGLLSYGGQKVFLLGNESRQRKGDEIMVEKADIFCQASINRALTRIAHESLEKNKGGAQLMLVGIKTRGAPLAKRLQKKIKQIENITVPIGELDITFYRDDLEKSVSRDEPVLKDTNINVDVTDKRAILIDDVLYTGRTIRAAMASVTAIGLPSLI